MNRCDELLAPDMGERPSFRFHSLLLDLRTA